MMDAQDSEYPANIKWFYRKYIEYMLANNVCTIFDVMLIFINISAV